MKFPRWARGWLTFGLPALIIIIFIMGYWDKFKPFIVAALGA